MMNWIGIGLRVALAHLIFLGPITFTPIAQAAIEDCQGKSADGKAICTKPEGTPWSMGYCPVNAPYLADQIKECTCSGGTWGYNTGCVGGSPIKGESALISQASCFTTPANACNVNLNWSGWMPIGSSTDAYATTCAHFEAKMVQGIEISNWGEAKPTGAVLDSNGNCVPTTFLTLATGKSRSLVCPAGFQGRELADGSIECWRFLACPTCGDPNANPGDGSSGLPQGDYSPSGGGGGAGGGAAGSGSGSGGDPLPLGMSRTYSSYPYYAAVQGDDRGTYGFGSNWISNYDAHIFYDPTNPGITATAQRADGSVKNFDLQGNELGVLTGNDKDNLVAIKDGSGTTTGWRYTTARADQVETYSADGRLLTIKNRFGLTQTLTYSDATTPANVAPRPNLLLKVTDPFGRSLNFIHDSEGRISRMTDPGGGLYDYTYDEIGNLIQVAYPDTGDGKRRTRQYLYGESAYTGGGALSKHLTGAIDENASRFLTLTYNSYGKIVARENAGGVGRITYSYGNLTTAVQYVVGDPNSPTITTRNYQFSNVDGKIKNNAILDPNTNQPAPCSDCGSTGTKTYDTNGFLASTRDWNGNLTCYTNDTRGQETQRIEGLSGTSCPGTATSVTRTTNTTWHATFHLPLTVAEPLRITTYTYDANGLMLTRSVQATSDATGTAGLSATPVGAARTSTYTYNSNGQVLTIDGPRTDVTDVSTYTYYGNSDPDLGKRSNVASITNALGQTTQITAYNAYGQPLTIVDPNGLTTQLTYDGRKRLTSRNVGGEVTAYVYDAYGQLTQVTMPDSSSISYIYDGAHRLTGMQDNLGNSIAYTLDLKGNRMREQVLDPSGQLAQMRSRVYDALNRLQKDIGAQNQTTQYAYDAQGNLKTVTDPLSRVTTNSYDGLNRLISMTQPAPAVGQSAPVIGYAYNGLDQLTQVTDPRTLLTTYAYDGLGNMNQQVSPDTGTTSNTYDLAGNILTSTDAKSQATTYTYDALNRVASVTYNQATGTQLKTVAYTYDQGSNGVGRLTTVTETAANGTTVLQTTQYAYDQKGRLTQETRNLAGQSLVTSYTYNQTNGHLTGMTYPSGRSVAYSYDSLGRISQIASTASSAQGGQTQILVAGVAYQPFGGIKSYTLGNNQSVTRSYDQDGRISGYNLGSNLYNIGYDQAGRIVNILNASNIANSNSYGYDNLDRLIQASLPGNSNYAYSYDLTGNRTSRSSGSSTDTYSISPSSNQISQIAGSASRSFSYDANGSTTNDSNNLYTYDPRGRMVMAQNAAGSTTYQVGANGQRVRKTGTVVGDTLYIYDAQGKLITEATSAGQVKKEYFYLLDLPVAVFAQ